MECLKIENNVVPITDDLQYTLDQLDALRAKIESGELECIAFAGVLNDGDILSGVLSPKPYGTRPFTLLGALTVLKERIYLRHTEPS